ncbi:MAG: phosphohistidine phosphatase, partial [Magnetococcales bacterium]|nr:phosphohistidine phosphatase [Magnetococcales bacterium]
KQTALLVGKSLGFAEEKVVWNPTIYNADLADLLEVLSGIPEKSNLTLLIGHNPGLEFLYTFLGGRQPDALADAEQIKTATLALLTLPEDWSKLSPGCGSVLWVKHPKELTVPGQD